MNQCVIAGCERPIHVKSRGLCNVHYIRLRVHGNPLAGGEERGKPYEWIVEHLGSESEDCLIWPFSVNDHGYGRIRHEGREWVASRLMCTLKHGDAPSVRHEAAHSCGNGHKGCTNPNHLRWATPEENQADRVDHRTSNRGNQNGQSKLSENDVLRVVALKDNGVLQREIARQFDMSEMAVSDILTGRRWSWLTGIELKPAKPRRRQAANDNEQRRAVG